jgi:predicted RNase H-like nuclease (RuvC/YqgF family)
MADLALLQTIVSGILSGGGSAGAAFAAVFRDIKKRLKALEDKLGDDGTDGDPKTGLFLLVERLDEIARKLKKEIETWEEDPPEWLLRLINRAARSNSINLEHHAELERFVEQKFSTTQRNITRLEEQIENIARQVDSLTKRFDEDRSSFDRDSRDRTQEMGTIREQLATVNGLLRGIMTAMGYIETSKTPKKPPPLER